VAEAKHHDIGVSFAEFDEIFFDARMKVKVFELE
jgi:hypothetical protein